MGELERKLKEDIVNLETLIAYRDSDEWAKKYPDEPDETGSCDYHWRICNNRAKYVGIVEGLKSALQRIKELR